MLEILSRTKRIAALDAVIVNTLHIDQMLRLQDNPVF